MPPSTSACIAWARVLWMVTSQGTNAPQHLPHQCSRSSAVLAPVAAPPLTTPTAPLQFTYKSTGATRGSTTLTTEPTHHG
eukprot:6177948-Pyramimonas_sp.AAC.1